jgi:hypothetical protein
MQETAVSVVRSVGHTERSCDATMAASPLHPPQHRSYSRVEHAVTVALEFVQRDLLVAGDFEQAAPTVWYHWRRLVWNLKARRACNVGHDARHQGVRLDVFLRPKSAAKWLVGTMVPTYGG